MAYNGRSHVNKGRSSRRFNKRANKTMSLNKKAMGMRGGIRL